MARVSNWPARCRADIQATVVEKRDTAEMLRRILAFEMDDPSASFPFTSRLAREQGWTHAFTGRVITEYKRFVALAMVAGHPVSPSEAVDQAWHLHLLYTRSYWQDLCRDILGQDLHHHPTTGGPAESAKFGDWYRRTLESYRATFAEVPPPDIWPPPEQHARASPASRRVDASRFWIIPRPRIFRH